jgi:hypothetical protein
VTRREIVSVLLVLQGALWLGAGLAAVPLVALEPAMGIAGVLTVGLAATMFVLSSRVRRDGRWARRVCIAIEGSFLVGALLLALLPLGSLAGPVPVITNLGLPLAVILMLATSRGTPLRPTVGSL